MKLGDRLNIHHAVELPQRLHLAKRQPYLDRVGQAGKLRLNRCLRLAKPCNELILLSGDFSDALSRGLGDLGLGQASLAEPHRNIRRRLAFEHHVDQALFRFRLDPKRLAKPEQAKAN